MAETKSKGRMLRDLIEAPEILVSPGIFDGYSARLVESRGYKSGAISGAGLSECHLGYPDRGLMGLEENLSNCRNIADCSNLLLHADADTGYGNAVNVYFVTQAFEKAGMAAVMFEDQTWPKRCGHMVGKSVISAEEMVEKIRAACDARQDPEFVIKARTDAGADLLFADALLSEEDIRTVAANVSKPLTVNMGLGIRARSTTPLVPPKQLQDMGVAAVSYPRLLTTSAVRGMINGLDAFEEMVEANVAIDRPDLCVNFEELNDMLDVAFLDELEDRYAIETDKKAAE
jgi:2-methylisocitrate lyase-like PEP mutase family enzyme